MEIEFNILVSSHSTQVREFVASNNLNALAETDKWLKLIDLIFKKQYLKDPKKTLTSFTIGNTNFFRYQKIKEIIGKELKPFVELRNRLAHGQWAIAFNTVGGAQNQKITQHAWTISRKDLFVLKAIVINIPPLLKILLLSKSTFERDFDRFINKIDLAVRDSNSRIKHIIKINSKEVLLK